MGRGSQNCDGALRYVHQRFQGKLMATHPHTSYPASCYSSPYNQTSRNPDTDSDKTTARPCLYTRSTRTLRSAGCACAQAPRSARRRRPPARRTCASGGRTPTAAAWAAGSRAGSRIGSMDAVRIGRIRAAGEVEGAVGLGEERCLGWGRWARPLVRCHSLERRCSSSRPLGIPVRRSSGGRIEVNDRVYARRRQTN